MKLPSLLLKYPLASVLLTFCFLLLLLSHLLFLSATPPGLAHDEVEYQLSAKTFAMFGKDLSGYSFPLNLIATETEGNVSAVPIMLLAPFRAILPLTLFAARLPYFLLMIANTFALMWFVQTLFKKPQLSGIAGILFLINPWSFFLSRFTTESPFALLFMLLAMTVLLKAKGKQFFLAFLFFFLAFFSYHAAKLLVLPIVLLILAYRYFLIEKMQQIKRNSALLFLGGVILLLIVFFVSSQAVTHSNIAKRGSDIISLSSPQAAATVNQERKLSLVNPYGSVFLNKYTVLFSEVMNRYLTTFSPRVLFFEGDLRVVYAFIYHGLFYFLDALFLLVGSIFLVKRYPKQGLLLLLLILVSPLPSALNQVGTSYVHRSFLLLPLLLLVISLGISELITMSKRYLPEALIILLITGFYAISYLNFLHFYFYRYPITSGEYYSLDSRILSHFISLEPNQPIEVYTSNPRDTYTAFLYFANDPSLLRSHLQNVGTFNTTSIYSIKNVSFTYGCPADKSYNTNTTYIIATDRSCLHGKTPIYTFNNPKDAGPMYDVYNSTLCTNYPLQRWKQFSSGDYHIEQMNRSAFCQTWVSPY